MSVYLKNRKYEEKERLFERLRFPFKDCVAFFMRKRNCSSTLKVAKQIGRDSFE